MGDNVWFATANKSDGTTEGNEVGSSGFNGFPFHVPSAVEWDGVTFFEGVPSDSAEELARVYGPGTAYPVGLEPMDAVALFWRSKTVKLTFNVAVDWSVSRGLSTDVEKFRAEGEAERGEWSGEWNGSTWDVTETELTPARERELALAVNFSHAAILNMSNAESDGASPPTTTMSGAKYEGNFETGVDYDGSFLYYELGDATIGASMFSQFLTFIPGFPPLYVPAALLGDDGKIYPSIGFGVGMREDWNDVLMSISVVKHDPTFDSNRLGHVSAGEATWTFTNDTTEHTFTIPLFCYGYFNLDDPGDVGVPSVTVSASVETLAYWPYAVQATLPDGTPHPNAGAAIWNTSTGAKVLDPVTGM